MLTIENSIPIKRGRPGSRITEFIIECPMELLWQFYTVADIDEYPGGSPGRRQIREATTDLLQEAVFEHFRHVPEVQRALLRGFRVNTGTPRPDFLEIDERLDVMCVITLARYKTWDDGFRSGQPCTQIYLGLDDTSRD